MDTIVTLTMNPTVDVSVEVPRVEPDVKLRTGRPRRDPGGGGINVARALRRMEVDAPACFPSGGASGELLERLLGEEGVETMPVAVEGIIRENLTVAEEEGRQYRFVLPGPELSEDECAAVLDRLERRDPPPGWLVASGSLPPGVADDFYGRLARWARERDVRFAVDSSGAALRGALEEGVDLVKPNARELGQVVEGPVEEERQQVEAARTVVAQGGARIVAVSLGAGGLLLVTGESCERVPAPSVRPVSRVGAGDSAMAGLVLGLARGDSALAAARRGVAAGAAAVMTSGTELCRGEDVERLYRGMEEAAEERA
jgi:6-phosphofructokinase 2